MTKKILQLGIIPLAIALTLQGAAAQSVCPAYQKPVCGVLNGNRSVYSNDCYAKKAGARILHAGKCIAPGSGGVCTQEYVPVCATDPKTGKERTYGNLCNSELENATLLHRGACGVSTKQ